MAAPGWYPDPNMAATQRYWDGERWTEHVAPLATPAAMTVSMPVAQPRRRADGSLAGPSLVAALGTIGLGILFGVAALIVVVPTFVDSLTGPRWQVPGSYRTDLDTGTWILYERVDFGRFTTLGPADVEIVGPDIVVPGRDLTNETITINGAEFRGVIRFEVETAGVHDITVRGEPTIGGEVLLSRPVWDFFNRWPWFLVGACGGLLIVVGAVMWIVGGVNRGRAKRAAASTGPR